MYMVRKITRITKATLKKKNKVRGISLSDFRSYCIATMVKTVWY